MAHYAFIDSTGLVVEVITGRDETDVIGDISDWEAYYSTKREGLTAIRTSYNTMGGVHYSGELDENNEAIPSEDQSKALRFNYAGIGFTYDDGRDAFIPPKPFESWVLDEHTCLWVAPVPMPTDGEAYTWDEDAGDWVAVETPGA